VVESTIKAQKEKEKRMMSKIKETVEQADKRLEERINNRRMRW
jgi:transposase